MMKFIGKPYAGKPHVRFDEGAGKAPAFPALLYCNLFYYTELHGEVTESHRENFQ